MALAPSFITVAPGEAFEVGVHVIEPGSSFNAYDALLSYDPTAVTFLPADPISSQEGPYMTDACGNTFHRFAAEGDSLSVSHALLCNQLALTGPGSVYRLRFRADRPATTFLRFRTTRFYNAGLFVTPVHAVGAEIRIALPPVRLDVAVVGEGTVTKDPDLPEYEHGSEVTLIAVPSRFQHFAGWSGDAEGLDNPLTVVMDRDKSIVGTFEPDLYELALVVKGSGSVSRSPDQPGYTGGSNVLLTAVPDPDHRFLGWAGHYDGDENPLNVVMDGYRLVVAQFTNRLEVSVIGSGYVTRTPDQIAYDPGSVVLLAAFPGPGHQFAEWIGDVPTEVNPLEIAVDSNMVLVARFVEAPPPTLEVTVIGGGQVVKDPDLPHYEPGTLVMLTAVPDSEHRFGGWSGDVVSMDNPVGVLMDRSRHVTATFFEGIAPTVRVVFPNGGETLTSGEEVLLEWTATDNIGVVGVDLLISRAGPDGAYEPIATGIPNAGSHPWTVVGAATSQGVLRVVAFDEAGNRGEDVSDGPFSLVAPTTAVPSAPIEPLPARITPNPTAGPASAGFTLGRRTHVTVRIVDLQGRDVAVLASGFCDSGHHRISWSGRGRDGPVSPGVYRVRISTPDVTVEKRFVVIR